MRIGLQFAMPSELRALPEICEPFETLSGVPFFEIEPDIIACAGGVGKVNAAMSAEILCLKYGVDLLVNAGVAGCTRRLAHRKSGCALRFFAARRGHHRCGRPHRLGFHGEPSGVSHLETRALCGASTLAGRGRCHRRTATGDWFAVKSSRAAWVRDTFSPLLVEMEGCAIAQVCLRNQVPFTALKSVSDHLFSDRQSEEYFDFSQALEHLGRILFLLPDFCRGNLSHNSRYRLDSGPANTAELWHCMVRYLSRSLFC